MVFRFFIPPHQNASKTVQPAMTKLLKRAFRMGAGAEPDALASAAVFLASAASDYVTGTAQPVDGGYTSK